MAAPTQQVVGTRPANIDGRGYHGYVAGEDLTAGMLVYLHTDGRFYKADASADDLAAQVAGVVAKSATTGEGVSVFYDCHIAGYTGLTPGAFVYLAVAAGSGLAEMTKPGLAKCVGRVIDAETIHFNIPITPNTV